MSRYDTEGILEAQFEPGSGNKVLRNLLGVTEKAIMEQLETRELLRVTDELLDLFGPNHRFKGDDIRRMHRRWLRAIYGWAGKYRTVSMSKGGFPFASPAQIPALMKEFEETVLMRFTPCKVKASEVAEALATVHVELVLIHPFREGNGRVARLLSTLMALQAGLPPLDFSVIEGIRREEYFVAVQAGIDRNYKPMEVLFSEIIGQAASPRHQG